MNFNIPQLNLVLAWLCILMGFLSGMVMGMFFHRENWLGGYGSFKRRMYRLGHIAFFGLGAVNLMFWITVKLATLSGPLINVASWGFVVGAISMPLCCAVMAHAPRLQMVFAVPVISLLISGGLTLACVLGGSSL